MYLCIGVVTLIPWHVDIAVRADVMVAEDGKMQLTSKTSLNKGIHIYRGQNATFFPATDNYNPMYARIKNVTYTPEKSAFIAADVKSHTPLTPNEKVQGLLLIKGERKSLFQQLLNVIF